jgi:hypothetical protein|tara:strand:+ start:542 stop:802 length:261 start_codon:yes stop_codon:yes gene_type:complete
MKLQTGVKHLKIGAKKSANVGGEKEIGFGCVRSVLLDCGSSLCWVESNPLCLAVTAVRSQLMMVILTTYQGFKSELPVKSWQKNWL